MNLKKNLNCRSENYTSLRKNILQWYDKNGRSTLPWKTNDIYKIWISEIMLQQTQVKTVIPYYKSFIKKYPNINSLSNASFDNIMKLWSGLGFYKRAENIYKSCIKINNDFNGVFPKKYDDILSLPGVGRTTASAIVTFSGHERRSILDGNVKRFLSRLYGIENNTANLNLLWEISEGLLSSIRASDFIQAYMDIGSLICKKSKPMCEGCPVVGDCKSYPYKNLQSNTPKLSSKRNTNKKNIWALAILNQDGEFYLEKISYNNLWNGLYSVPIFHRKSDLFQWVDSFNLSKSLESKVWKFSHDLSHIKFTFNVVTCNIKSHKKISLSDDNWYNLSNIDFGIPKYQNKIFNKFKE